MIALLLAASLAPVPSGTLNTSDELTGVPRRLTIRALLVETAVSLKNVTFGEALAACNDRSRAEGLEPACDRALGRCDARKAGYRLLSDGEWTHAARTLNWKTDTWEWVDQSTGPARVLRGKGRSSWEPDRRTGARMVRNDPAWKPAPYAADWFAPYQDAPHSVRGQSGGLRVDSPDRAKWARLLGSVACAKPRPEARLVATHNEASYKGEMRYLRTEPDSEEKIYVMIPASWDGRTRLPVVVVPFYDVDTSVGRPLGGRRFTPPGTRTYAHLAVQYGFAAVAIRWFGESYGESYTEAVANLRSRHPKLTGLGKWVWDAQRLLDYMATRPEFDMRRVGMIGHSLGGKLTMYAAAMDDRIRAAVSSEPGIGLGFSNYGDPWYLDSAYPRDGTDHHELLALIAPRPFLLIGGDSADSDRSWLYINAAKPFYTEPDRIGYVNHRQGHSPTPDSIRLAMEWLERFLR